MNDGYGEVLEAIASDSPTPGGGSVAALSLAHSYALATMVAKLTMKSDKWKTGHLAAKNILRLPRWNIAEGDLWKSPLIVEIMDESPVSVVNHKAPLHLIGNDYCLAMASADAQAFDSVMAAYKLPKSTSDEIDHRKEAINKANFRAAIVPYVLAQDSVRVLEAISALAPVCNSNAITDLGAASQLAHSSVVIGALNVRINLSNSEKIGMK